MAKHINSKLRNRHNVELPRNGKKEASELDAIKEAINKQANKREIVNIAINILRLANLYNDWFGDDT